MKKLWIEKLNKYKEVPEYEDLIGTAKEVCDLCRRNELACNSNTELCIEFWRMKSFDGSIVSPVIRDYPPETLTKIRRTLTEAELIHPSKEIQEKREEIEKSYHNTELLAKAEQDWSSMFKRNNNLA